MDPSIRTVLVGMPADISDDQGEPRTWRSGFHKRAVSGQVMLGRENLAGDGQADRTVHGGAEKALLGYCGEHYRQWKDELGHGRLTDGAFGENLTLSGLDEEGAAIGDIFRVGTTLIQVPQPRQPCWKLARRCRIKDLPARAIASGRLGWYFRVLEEGTLQAGDLLVSAERPNPAWTIARINRLFFGPPAQAKTLLGAAAEITGMSPEFADLCRRRFAAA